MDGSGYKGLALKSRRPAAVPGRALKTLPYRETATPTAAGCWHVSKYSVGASMAELKTTDAAPTAGGPALWLPELLYPPDGANLPPTCPAGAIVADDDGADDSRGSPGSTSCSPWLAEAGRGRAIYYRLEALLLSARGLLGHELARERAQASGFNLLPVVMATGIALFYAAPAEPSLLVLAATTGLLALAAGIARIRFSRHGGFATALLFGCPVLSLGMLLAALELHRHAMPVPRADITAEVRGLVLASDLNRNGAPRYLVKPLTVGGLSAAELPHRIRLSGSKADPPNATGNILSGLARLRPLPAPYYPGGYDFAYHGWLDGLGLTGFFMGKASVEAAPATAASWRERLTIAQNRLREKIAGRIRNGLDGQAGHVAVALVTGDRSGLSEQTQESLRRSGLAHILAISGLHMALVTLTVIWLVRQCLVFVPGLSEQHAIKKWAIGAGFSAATLYLFLAGAGVATQRAWIMLSVMMLAAMLDRQAITMRSVAIAALIVLAIAPSSLFEPGFQMSFAAAAALVAAYRQWMDWQGRRERRIQYHRQAAGIGRMMGGYLAGLAMTSLIAGAATALFAAWHFHRIAPFGIAANLLAMPVVSLAVMPLCLLAALLMPYGFEALALKPLGVSIDAVLAISEAINGYHPGLETGLLPAQLPLLGALALVLLCGLRSRLRLTGVVPLVLLAGLWPSAALPPDILIAQDGRAIAVQQRGEITGETASAGLAVIHPAANRFVTEIWRRAYLPERQFSGFRADGPCARDICRFTVARKSVSLVYDPDLLAGECRRADILLAPRLWFVRCAGPESDLHGPELIVTRGDLEQSGSLAISIDGTDIRTVTTWPSPAETGAGMRQFAWQRRFDNVSRRFAEKQPGKGGDGGF